MEVLTSPERPPLLSGPIEWPYRVVRDLPSMAKPFIPILALASIVSVFAWGFAPVHASGGPEAPCDGESYPVFPEVDARPEVRVWFDGDIEGGWTPAACTGWDKRDFTVLVALAGRFHDDSGIEGFLGRVAAISSLRSMKYWSATRQRWRELVPDSFALDGPDKALRRPDFSVEELVSGKALYYWQRERSPANNVLYRIRLRETGPERIIVDMENALPVKRFLVTLFEPGQHQLIHFLEDYGDGDWNYYSLMRSRAEISALVRGHDASFINRAVAIYRYLAGIPTDQEPPAAP